MTELNMAQKHDREVAARKIIEACTKLGVEVERCPVLVDREIVLTMKGGRGVEATISLDGNTWNASPSYYVMWNIRPKDDARFSLSFWGANPYHRRKATMILYDFGALIAELTYALKQTFNGEAFDPVAERQFIEKEGTDAERNAQFDKWIREERERKAS